jgi:hypothetical protein
MVKTERPLDRLHALVRSGTSGELICAGGSLEIHVFLQSGKIVWATDSRHPFAFGTHLQEQARIDRETFRQVVEECRRERLPLGETLVEWGLATWEGVRASLAHQIENAITLLAKLDTAQILFLERAFASYNEKLTFELGEFSAPIATASAEQPVDRTGRRAALARSLRTSVEGLAWVEVLDGERVVDADPISSSIRVPLELVRATLHDGADFVAVRTARSSIVGLGVDRGRSLWCRLTPDSTFGGVVSAIWSIAGAIEKTFEGPPPRSDVAAWWLGSPHAPANEALGAFRDRAADVLAAIVLPCDPSHEPIAGCGSSALEPVGCVDIAKRRGRSLAAELLPADSGDRALDSMGYSLRSMASGEPRLWCFGAELVNRETLWLFLDRRTTQGLGWAYLSAVTRAMARVGAVGA